jgi:hypothetical protein
MFGNNSLAKFSEDILKNPKVAIRIKGSAVTKSNWGFFHT